MKNLKTLTCFASSLLLCLVVCAGTAQATEISGTISATLTIFDNSELVGDVTCMVTNAPCIKFGAPGIKLRLKGFTITGRADPPANCTDTIVFAPEDGILVAAQHDVAVLGPGIVQKFGRFGVFLSRSTKTTVKHVTSSDNCFSGIQVSGVTDSDIEENVSVRNAIAAAGFSCGGT
jgi:hypothetical protein